MAVSAARRNFENFFGFCTKKGSPGGEKPESVKKKNLGVGLSYIPALGQFIYVMGLHEVRINTKERTKGERAALAIRSICVVSVVGLIPLVGLDLIGTIMIHCHKKKSEDAQQNAGQGLQQEEFGPYDDTVGGW